MSRDPAKDAHRIPRYLIDQGYDVVPVNPHADQILSRTAHASLDEVLEPVDIVDIFRPSADVPPHVDRAIARGDGAVWMQLGIAHADAAAAAREAGLTVVQDRCMMVEHRRLVAGKA